MKGPIKIGKAFLWPSPAPRRWLRLRASPRRWPRLLPNFVCHVKTVCQHNVKMKSKLFIAKLYLKHFAKKLTQIGIHACWLAEAQSVSKLQVQKSIF